MSNYFPPLTPGPVNAVLLLVQRLSDDPTYLDENCPYSPDMIAILKDLVPKANLSEGLPKEPVDPDSLDLEVEVATLFVSLQQFKDKVSPSDMAESMSYYRTCTALLEKLLVFRERATAIKQFNKFQEAILATMDSYLTPDQRTELTDRIAQLTG